MITPPPPPVVQPPDEPPDEPTELTVHPRGASLFALNEEQTLDDPLLVPVELRDGDVTDEDPPRSIETVGQVVIPTGILEVTTIGAGFVVGTVTKEYHRIQPGDLVRPLPTYSAQEGVYAEEVSGGSEAMVMGFAGRAICRIRECRKRVGRRPTPSATSRAASMTC